MDDFEEKKDGLEKEAENTENTDEAAGTASESGENGVQPGQQGFGADGFYRYSREEIKNNSAPSAGTPASDVSGSEHGGNYSGYPQQPGYYGQPYGYHNRQSGYDRPYPYGNYGGTGASGQPGGNYAYPEKPDKGKKGGKKVNGSKVFAIVAGVLCVVLIIALVAVVSGGYMYSARKTPGEDATTLVSENAEEIQTKPSHETSDGSANAGELSPKGVYRKVLKSSVGILVYDKNKALASEGSGIIFQESKDGKSTYIITCAHVIAGSSKVLVQLHNNKEFEAAVVGFDTRTDIGVLRIEAKGLDAAEIGDSSKVAVGDTVYAIGNPGGVEFANSFTEGMVSALDRPVNSSSTGYTMECIQHTAAINPGNSGGALLNAFGQVIGINSMKIVANEYEGMGFSVPSSVFVDIVNNIMVNGYVSNRPKLGITYVAASELNKYGMFVAIKKLPSASIVIHSIAEDSALSGTDAREGDLIVAVNGVNLDEKNYLAKLVEKSSVGDKLTLSLIRIHDDYSYDEFKVTATLVEDRGDTYIDRTPKQDENNSQLPEDFFKNFFDDYFKEFYEGNGGK